MQKKMNRIIVTLLLGEYHRLNLTWRQRFYFPASSRLLRPVSVCHKDVSRILSYVLQTDFNPSVWFASAINCDRPLRLQLRV